MHKWKFVQLISNVLGETFCRELIRIINYDTLRESCKIMPIYQLISKTRKCIQLSPYLFHIGWRKNGSDYYRTINATRQQLSLSDIVVEYTILYLWNVSHNLSHLRHTYKAFGIKTILLVDTVSIKWSFKHYYIDSHNF